MRQLLHCFQVRKHRERDEGAQRPTFLVGLPFLMKPLRELLQDKPTGMSVLSLVTLTITFNYYTG